MELDGIEAWGTGSEVGVQGMTGMGSEGSATDEEMSFEDFG